MNSFAKKIIVLIVTLLLTCYTFAQSDGLMQENSYVKSFGRDEFNVTIQFYSVGEDSNGCIIAGTSVGLYLMDSNGFNTYYTESGTQFNLFRVDKYHNIFILGDVEIGYFKPYDNGNFDFVSLRDDVDVAVTDIIDLQIKDDFVYYIAKNAIYVYDYHSFRKVPVEGIVKSVAFGNCCCLLSSEGNLYSFNGFKCDYICNLSKAGFDIQRVNFLNLEDTTLCITDNNLTCLLHPYDLVNGEINIHEKPFPNFIRVGNSQTVISGMAYDPVLKRIAVSSNHGIWIFSYKGDEVRPINYSSGLPLLDVRKVFFDSKHNLWAVLSNYLAKIDINSALVYYKERQGVFGEVLNFAHIDGNYYCGSFNGLSKAIVDHHSPGFQTHFYKIEFDKAVNANPCWSVVSFEGEVLACTTDGLYQVEGLKARRLVGGVKMYNCISSPKYPGKLFITSAKGLIIADYKHVNHNIEITNYHFMKGFDYPVKGIKIDKRGNLWVSSIFDGLFYIVGKDPNFDKYSYVTISNNLGLKWIRQLVFNFDNDKFNVLEYRYYHSELPEREDFFANEINFVPDSALMDYTYFLNLDSTNDIVIKDGNSLYLAEQIEENKYKFDTIILKDRIRDILQITRKDSLLYLATGQGLIKYNLNHSKTELPECQPFDVIITNVNSFDSILFRGYKYFSKGERHLYSGRDGEPVVLGSNYSSLKFSYASASLECLDLMKYSFYLEGYDTAWSKYTTNTSHDYLNLPPGTYTFHVRAKNSAGVVSSEAEFIFTIKTAWYLTWWAISIDAIIVFLIVYLGFRLKTRSLHRENVKLERLASERNFEIIRQNEKLRLLSLVASKTANCIIILEPDGIIKYVNHSFQNIYGYSLDSFKQKFGNNYFEEELINNSEHSDIIQKLIDSKESYSFENSHTSESLGKIWVQTIVDPVFDRHGELCNWIINETDITQLKKADQEVLLQTKALTEAYMDLSERKAQIEFQKRQLLIINERLDTGFKQIHRQNMTIKDSIRYAQSIQTSILPLDKEISEFLDFFIIYLPKDIVSGDFYMYEKLSDDSFITIVADCTGHGVPGAFMSLIGYNILSQIIKIQNITDPVGILEILSRKLIEVLKQDEEQNSDGMDISICRLDKNGDSYDVSFSGTRCSIYLYSKAESKLQRIKGSQRQIGWGTEFTKIHQFVLHQFKLTKDDFIVMLSDGLIDQSNDNRRRFGSERFSEFLVLNSQVSMPQMGKNLGKTLDQFMNGSPQRDDITVFGFKIK